MNLYFLVEGRSTEKKIYPKLVNYFLKVKLRQIDEFYQAEKNDFYLLTANGYPRIFTNILKNSIIDINSVGNYNYLILCIDADESTIEERQQELNKYIKKFKEEEGLEISPNCKIKLVVQDKCIESWFLGNTKIFKANPSNSLLVKYQSYYNVQLEDPELMPTIDESLTTSNFHYSYLKKMLSERNVRYTKNTPNEVGEHYYLKELVERNILTKHLNSFKGFIDLCKEINRKIEAS